MRFSENMDGKVKDKGQLKQEEARRSKKKPIPRNLLGLKEFRLYLVRLGEPVNNFKWRVIRIVFSVRRIVLAAVQGKQWRGAR